MYQRTGPRQVREAIWHKALRDGTEANNLKDLFFVAIFTVQHRLEPLLYKFDNLMSAEKYALQAYTGNIPVYVMSANPQHGLQQVVNNQLVFVLEEAAEVA